MNDPKESILFRPVFRKIPVRTPIRMDGENLVPGKCIQVTLLQAILCFMVPIAV